MAIKLKESQQKNLDLIYETLHTDKNSCNIYLTESIFDNEYLTNIQYFNGYAFSEVYFNSKYLDDVGYVIKLVAELVEEFTERKAKYEIKNKLKVAIDTVLEN